MLTDVDTRTTRSASLDHESEDCCCLIGVSAAEERELNGCVDDGDGDHVGVVCIPATPASMKGPETPPKPKRTASNVRQKQ